MTKAQLRTAIKREARILANSDLDTLVDDIVVDILRDLCNLARYHELFVEGAVVTLVAAQQEYSLPNDYQHMGILRFGRGPNPTTFRDLKLQTGAVKQTWNVGYPLFYRLIRGNKISIYPYINLLTTDQLLLDYYIDPLSIFDAEDDDFPVPRLEGAVKKQAIARVQRFSSSLPEAQASTQDASGSINAANAAAD